MTSAQAWRGEGDNLEEQDAMDVEDRDSHNDENKVTSRGSMQYPAGFTLHVLRYNRLHIPGDVGPLAANHARSARP